MQSPIHLATDLRRLYADLAWAWPLVSPVNEYATEAGEFHRAIQQHASGETRNLLDLGCGGGNIDFHLVRHYAITGIDVSEPMLDLARQLNPQVTYLQGDIRTARLEQRFDVAILADAVNYMLSLADLRSAFETAYTHLRPGGLFVTYAEAYRERFEQNRTVLSSHGDDRLSVTLVENSFDPDPQDETYERVFLFMFRRDRRLEIEIDRHLSGLFSLDTWEELLKQAGFDLRVMEFDSDHMPWFIARRPTQS